MSREFLLFVLIGAFAATINLLARLLFSLAIPFEISVILAYPVGMTVAFVLNRYFVFNAGGSAATGQYVRFALVNLLALVQIWLVSVGLARYLFPAIGFVWHSETIAHAIALGSPILTSYFAHKYFSFRTV
ncbi:GtrA family protein [Ancylobacter pratisalsi]|uniref:GtrA family protein n=1 Tax=Ancylobacter pratisalsi TaxID=1745854 RepID=A0A6P1YS34_9HYPH|nr:GtrA family protein [Ancylobacter pratisalsi]QIB35835.1 GtrA family protein [Ancylobacter pratisalsi]